MHLGKRYKHLQRYREITGVLLKHGFGHIMRNLGLLDFLSIKVKLLLKKEPAAEMLSPAQRVRLALEGIGPTFIKIGQILSTRPDLLAPDYIKELEKLQDRVPAFSFDEVKRQIESELALPVEQLFEGFDPEPLAAASIGQVHRAVLPGDKEVAVKIRRPGIEKVIETDIEILYDVARFLEKRSKWAEMYSFVEMVSEFDRTLHEELDYHAEGRNADTFTKNFAGDDDVVIPAVYWEYTSKKVLTMEYLEGVKFSNISEIERTGLNREALARKVAQAIFKQILIDGFFHGDPHPGNLAALPGEKIVFMDFGMAGHLPEETKNIVGNLMMALISKNANEVMKAVLDLGVAPKSVDKKILRRDIDLLQRKYYEIPLSQIKLGEALNDIMGIAFRHRVRIPPEFALLVKSLLTLEGIVGELDPGLSIVTVAEPFGRQMLRERFSPRKLTGNAARHLLEMGNLLPLLPKKTYDLLDLAAEGELKLKHQFPQVEEVVDRVNIMVNRLAFGIVIAGLVIGSALISQGGYLLFGQVPVAEIGFLIAGVMGFWFLVSILRSGGF